MSLKIKEVWAEKIKDSRKEDTIQVFVKTEFGTFSASSPYGKSTGKYEVPSFPKGVRASIEMIEELAEKLKEIEFEKFNDLAEVEKLVDRKEIGANALYALEAGILKALAYGQRKEVWQMINPEAKRMPNPVGNIIGGGMHTAMTRGKRADFQEFLIIPRLKNFADNVSMMKKAHEIAGDRLKLRKARGVLNDEGAWCTNLSNEECLEILEETRNEIEQETESNVEIGIDAAASSFYEPHLYHYKNPERYLNSEEQMKYISDLAEKSEIFYIEDPLNEDDFQGFRKFRGKNAGRMIVGDDLTVSNEERFLKALKEKSIDAVIVKPNQTGSLLEIKKIVYLAKKYNVALVLSHRSGETMDSVIADLAFGFQVDYIKTGAIGAERDIKLYRLIEIEKLLEK